MKPFLAAVFLSVFGLALPSASAGSGPAPASQPFTSAADSDCARAKQHNRPCRLVFDTGDEIDGDRASVGHDEITGRVALPFSNLIQVRESFRAEVLRSAEAL
ncbi:hypothetical protein [Haliangium ochraceum]|uniref:Uncharacterized protein n=1 Tax=Haliangium ochraceum (strain DSM 14365 / JCM 11303 / SMP-2) TaxID=502025 RepID=D0LFQ4_HALO1|nr:hypothetical protein [Haliangium ochraceum]ACY12688.1 hypothetical protein Hoch_0046 [Haliangium ochraceum DSM 14365]